MTRLPPLPRLSWSDAASPRSLDHDDIYFSGDGAAETRAVFFAGCELPEAWAGRRAFTVGELGFGSGANIAALIDLWDRTRSSPDARLDVLSVESSLMTVEDAARTLKGQTDLAGAAERLLSVWPDRARGMQRIDLGGGLRLTLAIGDAAEALRGVEAAVDAWFLDGFAPARNPQMWSAEVIGEIARLSAPGARVGSYTVAGDVRRRLAEAGFEARKAPGHGAKRERLEAVFGEPGVMRREGPARVAVIGAGAAGANVARSFIARGAKVTLIDAGRGFGSGASGNRLALVMPRLDAADSEIARALVSAHLLARRRYLALGGDAATGVDVTRLPRGVEDQRRFERLLADPPLDASLMSAIAPATPGRGLLLHGAAALHPARVLPALCDGAELMFATGVTAIEPTPSNVRLALSDDRSIEADLVVAAAGAEIGRLFPAIGRFIEGRQGQVDHVARATPDETATVDGAYVVEALGAVLAGATFEAVTDEHPAPSPAARAHNLEVLDRLRPELAVAMGGDEWESRVGVRATTPDRLPIVGAASEAGSERVQVLGGLGSHGYLWSPLLAEQLASWAFGEPLPMTRDQVRALSPARFEARALRRAGGRRPAAELPLDDA